uniref:Uncharacterized protein n=1 Tax=Zea mays TaxID=4577 RepID=A0A804P3E0_MAIZE
MAYLHSVCLKYERLCFSGSIEMSFIFYDYACVFQAILGTRASEIIKLVPFCLHLSVEGESPTNDPQLYIGGEIPEAWSSAPTFLIGLPTGLYSSPKTISCLECIGK